MAYKYKVDTIPAHQYNGLEDVPIILELIRVHIKPYSRKCIVKLWALQDDCNSEKTMTEVTTREMSIDFDYSHGKLLFDIGDWFCILNGVPKKYTNAEFKSFFDVTNEE